MHTGPNVRICLPSSGVKTSQQETFRVSLHGYIKDALTTGQRLRWRPVRIRPAQEDKFCRWHPMTKTLHWRPQSSLLID